MPKIIYNIMTESIEDFDNSVIVTIPDDMDAEYIEEYLRDHTIDVLESDAIIGFDQAVAIIRKTIPNSVGVHPSMANSIVEQVVQALGGALA